MNSVKIKTQYIKLLEGSSYLRKRRNKKIKIKNGNINTNNIKIVLWNKGSSNMSAKMNDIKEIISKQRPQVLIITELNFEEYDHDGLTKIKGFNFIHDNLRDTDGCSRTGMCIQNKMSY